MPNLLPRHIETADDVDAYRARLDTLLPAGTTPIMTISLKPTTTPEIIRACRGKIWAVKYYPGGVTTNSGGSTGDIDPDDEVTGRVFDAMIECGIILSLHPETTVTRDSHGQITKGFVHRAEREFRTLAERIAEKYPKLMIVIEHISTRDMAELVECEKYPNLYGSITPQHLLLTAHDKEWGHAFETHLHCKPTLKDPEDLIAIQRLVYSGNQKVFFGSDSAPHPQDVKECAHCASGVFSSPIAIQIVTDWWMSDTTSTWWQSVSGEMLSDDEKIARLQRFFCENGEALYPRVWERTITLEKSTFTIPASYPTKLPDLSIVPMWAWREIGWKIVDNI
jgi:dihydroorotase